MKICWDNLEKLEYRPDRGEWQDKKWNGIFYIYKNSCKNCKEPFLAQKGNKGVFCDYFCRKHSEKTKEKISISNSGKNNPMFGIERLDMMGENNPAKRPEVRAKIGKAHKGKNVSNKTKLKISENHADVSGENNPNWRGGISCEPYCDVWLDKDFKESIKDRDGYQCLNPVCENNSNTLCIHHINYIKKDCSPFNLITLCNSCNSKANKNREWHESWYNVIINRRYGK